MNKKKLIEYFYLSLPLLSMIVLGLIVLWFKYVFVPAYAISPDVGDSDVGIGTYSPDYVISVVTPNYEELVTITDDGSVYYYGDYGCTIPNFTTKV